MSGYNYFQYCFGFLSYIINTSCLVKDWVASWTDDPNTIKMLKSLCTDLQALPPPTTESSASLRKRAGVSLTRKFLCRKVFEGPAFANLTSDIRQRYGRDLREMFTVWVLHAELLAEQQLKASIANGTGEEAFEGLREEVMRPIWELLQPAYLSRLVREWYPVRFAFHVPSGKWYIMINGLNNTLKGRFASLAAQHRSSTPILANVMSEIANHKVWAYDERQMATPDTRTGWIRCETAGKDQYTFTRLRAPPRNEFKRVDQVL